MKNHADALIFTRLFVSERKQIALFRHKKLFELFRAVLHDKSFRNEDYYETFYGHLQNGITVIYT